MGAPAPAASCWAWAWGLRAMDACVKGEWAEVGASTACTAGSLALATTGPYTPFYALTCQLERLERALGQRWEPAGTWGGNKGEDQARKSSKPGQGSS